MANDSKFNKKEYDRIYKLNHYSQLKFTIKKEKKEELERILKDKNLTKIEFLNNAIEDLKFDKR